MVISSSQHIAEPRIPQASRKLSSEPSKINANTYFDFQGKDLTPYGGLFPVATMLEKLKFQEVVEATLTRKRKPRSMTFYQFILSMVLAIYVGFSRLHHIRYVARDPMLTRILKVLSLPVQSTYWRFLDSLHGVVAQQLLQVQRRCGSGCGRQPMCSWTRSRWTPTRLCTPSIAPRRWERAGATTPKIGERKVSSRF